MTSEIEQRSNTADGKYQTPAEVSERREATIAVCGKKTDPACVRVFLGALAKYSVSRAIAASLHRTRDDDRD